MAKIVANDAITEMAGHSLKSLNMYPPSRRILLDRNRTDGEAALLIL
jgi:hypothetical protein